VTALLDGVPASRATMLCAARPGVVEVKRVRVRAVARRRSPTSG
jgi:hypothetical protein